MSDINFLANKKRLDDQEPKNRDDRKEKIAWSKPEGNKPIEKGATWLSFLKKKKEDNREAAAGSKPAIDKDKIRESRREILELIKHNESLGLKEEKPASKNWPTSLIGNLAEGFKKQPGREKVLIDYQRVFNQEEGKGVRPALNNQPAEEKRAEAPRPVKEHRDNFLGRLFKLIKKKSAAPNLPAAKLAKVNLAETDKKTKAETVKAPRPQLSGEARDEKEIKSKLAKQTESPPVVEKVPKVLDTNLIKGEIVTFFEWRKKIIVLIVATLIPAFLIGLAYFGLKNYQGLGHTKIQTQAQKIDELKEKIKQEEQSLKEITEFQNRLKTVSQIFAQHIYWTNFFKFLEDNTIKDVYYDGFSGDTSGNYSLGANALKFDDIAKQVNALKDNKKIIDAKTTGGAADQTGVRFNLNFLISKDIFTE